MTSRQHSQKKAPVSPKISAQVRSRKMRAEESESANAALVAPPSSTSLLDQIDPDLRHRMISEAAFHLYEKRGFADGYDMDDWLQAELTLERELLERPLSKGPTPQD